MFRYIFVGLATAFLMFLLPRRREFLVLCEELKNPSEVIDVCLDVVGDFVLTKAEVAERIVAGGYLLPTPKTARGVINTSINYHLSTGYLILKDDKLGRSKAKARNRKSSR